MSGVSSGVWIVLFIFYFIFLWIINHKLFTFIYFDLGRGLLKEFLTYFILALILTAVTIALWWVADIILAIIALVAILKCDTKGKRIAVAIIFGILILAIAIVGIKNSKDSKQKKDQRNDSTEEISYESNLSNGNTTIDYSSQDDAYNYSTHEEPNPSYISSESGLTNTTNVPNSNVLLRSGNFAAFEENDINDIPVNLMNITVNNNTMSGTITIGQSSTECHIPLTTFDPNDYYISGSGVHDDYEFTFEITPEQERFKLQIINAQNADDHILTGYYFPSELQQSDIISENHQAEYNSETLSGKYISDKGCILEIGGIDAQGCWCSLSNSQGEYISETFYHRNTSWRSAYMENDEYIKMIMQVKEDGIHLRTIPSGKWVEGIYHKTDYEDNSLFQSEISSSYYMIPDSSVRYLSETELQYYTYEELRLAINEIYAKHGRIFTDPELADYFTSKEWYNPTTSADRFDDSVFNEYEKENLKLLATVKESKAN